MKEIEVFIVINENSPKEPLGNQLPSDASALSTAEYLPCATALKEQSEYLGVEMAINVVNANKLPQKVKSRMVMVLDQSIFLPEDFLLNLVSLNNIYKSEAVLCGPVRNHIPTGSPDWFVSDVASYYKSYSIGDFSSSMCFEITGERHNYPPCHALTIPSRAYNLAGGLKPMKTPRGNFSDNSMFVNRIASKHKLIYAKSLESRYFISPTELSLKNFSRYFYVLGYKKGFSFREDEEESYEKIWRQFVNSSDPNDNMILNCLERREDLDQERAKIYSQKIASFKCVYSLGLLEGLQGEPLL